MSTLVGSKKLMFEMTKISRKVVLLALVLGGIMSSSARAQSTNKGSPKVTPASQRATGGDKSGKRLDSDTSSDQGRNDQPERPDRSDKSNQPDASGELKKIRDEFKQVQNRFVEEQKELRQKLKEATEDDRARIRNEIQTKRQSFVDQQVQVRDEIRRLMQDLKDKLKDHRDVLDAAKEDAKDKAKARKGGD